MGVGHPLDNYFDFLPAFANRFSVRFLAAARDAFRARATRSARVIVSRLRFPPFAPIWAIAFRIRLRDNVSIQTIIQSYRLGKQSRRGLLTT